MKIKISDTLNLENMILSLVKTVVNEVIRMNWKIIFNNIFK